MQRSMLIERRGARGCREFVRRIRGGRCLSLAAESPKHDQNKVRPSAYKVQRRGIVVSCAQSGWECGQDSMDCTPKSLSQRREFLGVAANEAGSATLLTELRVTTSRGQKGRQVVEKDALAGQCQMLPTVARHPRPGTREMAGIAAALACRGQTGILGRLRVEVYLGGFASLLRPVLASTLGTQETPSTPASAKKRRPQPLWRHQTAD